MEGACAKAHLRNRYFQYRLANWVDTTPCSHVGGAHVRVACEARHLREACALHLARHDDALAYQGRRFAAAVVGEFFVWDTANLQMQVNAVEERSAQALLIALHHRRGAGAGVLVVAGPSARAGVHRADEDKLCWKCHRPLRAANRHRAVFKSLA